MDKQHSNSRREFVKKAAYLPPAILTLAVAPSYAKAGSLNPTALVKDQLPPGLAKKDQLPPGLAKKDQLPPGLAKKVD